MELTQWERGLEGRTPALMGGAQGYAVLVPLVEQDGALHLLFEVRADTLQRQPGEVCFPGGKIEPGETPTECALRETWEELGISPQAVRLVAPLDFMYHASGFLLHPILARVELSALAELRHSTSEVKATFLVPLAFFQNTAPMVYRYDLEPKISPDFPYEAIGFPGGYHWRTGHWDVPIYHYQGHPIWGLTGRIVRWLTQQLEA